jgi:hypothetical protein
MGAETGAGSAAEAIGARVLATLRLQADRNRQAAEVMREKIRRVLAEQAEPRALSARNVRAQLPVAIRPSLRTVQEHLKNIRAGSSVSRDELMQSETNGS